MQLRSACLNLCLCLAALVQGCNASTSGPDTEFVIRVDSISGPNAVSGGAAAEYRLWGTVGPTGCYAFRELRTSRVPSRVDVTVIGERTDNAICTQAFVMLNGERLRVEPIIPDPFTIVVHQPDGTTLTMLVRSE